MSVKHLMGELRKAANSSSARDFQYRNHVIDYMFHNQLIIEELIASMAGYIRDRRSSSKITTTDDELTAIKQSAITAFNTVYTVKKIEDAHRTKGYKVIKDTPTAEEQLARYSGFTTTVKGKPKPIKRGNYKKAVIVSSQSSMAPGPHYSGGYTGLKQGPVATYASSMDQKMIGGQGSHNAVVSLLWYEAVGEHKKELIKLLGKAPDLGSRIPMAMPSRIGRNFSKALPSRRAIRLHGPSASKSAGGFPQGGGTLGAAEDTSVPVVAIVDALKDLDPNTGAVPKNITNHTMHSMAFRDIMHALDTEFTINGKSITDIVEFGKVIRIKMAQGGEMHQIYMQHADLKNVNEILDRIEKDLIANFSDPDYVTSKPVSKMAQDAVVAQVIKNFTTKSGKPDMRYKVNKQAALNKAKKRKETSKGKVATTLAGRKKVTKKRKSTKVRSRVRVNDEQFQPNGNPLALAELINKMLPEALLMKMQAPALVNRTGRFRSSAEVTNVMIGPRGGTNVEYTYQRDPYEVFEPGSGSPLANQYRDPRAIIGGTVRELAQTIMGKKFIRTRRV